MGDFECWDQPRKAALEIAESAEHPLSEVLGWLSIGRVLLRKGELEGAVSALERGLELCDAGRIKSGVLGWPLASLLPMLARAYEDGAAKSPSRQSTMLNR